MPVCEPMSSCGSGIGGSACKPWAAALKDAILKHGQNQRVKFNLIDKIEAVTDGKIVGVKFVSLAEEYLADHFPSFPVLPGVMMLEAATQAAGWLLHRRSDFARSFAVLKEARNVKYGNFVAPGNFLRIEAELMKETSFKVIGTVNDKTAFTARIEMAYFDLGDEKIDGKLKEHNRSRWSLIAPATDGRSGPRITSAALQLE